MALVESEGVEESADQDASSTNNTTLSHTSEAVLYCAKLKKSKRERISESAEVQQGGQFVQITEKAN